MIVSRLLEKAILRQGRKYPVISVTGPRQSGKSTLIRNIFPRYNYASLEDPDTRQFAEEDPRGFLTKYGPGSVLDEAQRVPKLFNYLQGITDNNRKTAQYILSGSHNFLMMDGITQSLAGRVALFKLLPFSYAEVKHLKQKPKNADEAIYKGFYPRVYDKHINPVFFYQSYIETYIERDIPHIKEIGDSSRFIRFLKLCAARAGQLLNLQSLANETGISQPTAKSWLSVLEKSYIVFLLQPYFQNISKRLVKTPKLYFYDTGLAAHLLDIRSSQQVGKHALAGNLFENMVIAELYKKQYHAGFDPRYYFLRDSNQNEIDIVWSESSRLNKLEIKKSSTVNTSYFSVIRKLTEEKYLPRGRHYLVMEQQEIKKWKDFIVTNWKAIDAV